MQPALHFCKFPDQARVHKPLPHKGFAKPFRQQGQVLAVLGEMAHAIRKLSHNVMQYVEHTSNEHALT